MVAISYRTRKADKNLYNYSAEDFIPIACHFNESTLLTKNGELIQTIHINGINAETISQELVNLRKMVRNAIKKNINSHQYAFWIHTVRRKTNLDDLAPYDKLLSANIHNMWRSKNYWDDKFVNTLYISIIYKGVDLKIKNISSLINSLFSKVVLDFHDKYFDDSFKKLNSSVDKILADLSEYGAKKLAVRFEGEETYSDLMFLYRRIIHLNEDHTTLPIGDLSTALASHHYAVGSDKIEVISAEDKKFAAMISIKEYQEVSNEALDTFLQLPVEMIATEIFYFVERKEVAPIFAEQDYILKVSGDSELRDAKGIGKIMNKEEKEDNKFCHQQISITIIGENLQKLDTEMYNASSKLAEIGIVHVREDINLEQTFWAQLPGNFAYLRRMTPTILENTAALTSLHNFPTGSQYSKWGRAVTLLRTEKGTPYFMNFHNKDNKGNTCIYGSTRSGKTVLMNFLISEATKFKPDILYIANNNDSKIFIEAIEGSWKEEEKNLINPFLLEDNKTSRDFLQEFLKIVCNHYTVPLTAPEIAFLDRVIDAAFALKEEERNFPAIIKSLDFKQEGGELIKSKLAIFDKGGSYEGVFDNKTRPELGSGKAIGFNLNYFTDGHYEKSFYPEEKNLIDQFKINAKIHSSVRWGIIYALTHYIAHQSLAPTILAIDNIGALCRQDQFTGLLAGIFEKVAQNNGVVISNFNLNTFDSVENQMWHQLFDLSDTNIIMPSNVLLDGVDKILNLSKAEVDKLSTLLVSSRMFLIRQNEQSIAAELSLGGFGGILKILSAQEEEHATYKNILEENPGGPDKWLEPLYKAFESNR